MLVNDKEMIGCETTYDYIDLLSMREEVTVQYPDGALWCVNNLAWRKMNNA